MIAIKHNLNLSHNIYKDTKRGTYYFRITYYDKSNTRKYITRKGFKPNASAVKTVSYTHLRAHETTLHLVCRLLLEKIWPIE
ncbi:hypothetical protein JMUB7515_28030 [Staphylococcus aureus]